MGAIRAKISEWRANRAWKVWASNVMQDRDAIALLQFEDGFVKPYPADYDATLDRYLVDLGGGEVVPIMVNQDTDVCNLDGVSTIFAYDGQAYPVSDFETAELARRTFNKWNSGELFLHKDDLVNLQNNMGGLDEDEIDLLETDENGNLHFKIKDEKVGTVDDVKEEERKAQENDEYLPKFYFGEDGYVRDSDQDRVLKFTEIPVPDTHSVDLRQLGRVSASDESAPSDMRRTEDEAINSQNHPDNQGGSSLAKVGYISFGFILAVIMVVLNSSLNGSSSGGGSSGGGGGGSGGGGGGPDVPGIPGDASIPLGHVDDMLAQALAAQPDHLVSLAVHVPDGLVNLAGVVL